MAEKKKSQNWSILWAQTSRSFWLSKAIGQKSGGVLSKMLENLEESDVIRTYTRYGGRQKETVYQLVDFFSLFYLRHIEKGANVQKGWKSLQRSPQFFAWAGITFELVVMMHQQQLAHALHLGTISSCYCWKGMSTAGIGAQIDMVLEWKGERTDYLFEIKFSESTYAIDADYEQNLRNKIDAFLHSKKHNPVHSINMVFLTTFGLSKGMYNGITCKSVWIRHSTIKASWCTFIRKTLELRWNNIDFLQNAFYPLIYA